MKASLAKQFANARSSTVHVPHEHDSVKAVEGIVNGQLDFLLKLTNPGAVRVEASGSAYSTGLGSAGPSAGSTQVKLEVMPLHGFVE